MSWRTDYEDRLAGMPDDEFKLACRANLAAARRSVGQDTRAVEQALMCWLEAKIGRTDLYLLAVDEVKAEERLIRLAPGGA